MSTKYEINFRTKRINSIHVGNYTTYILFVGTPSISLTMTTSSPLIFYILSVIFMYRLVPSELYLNITYHQNR